LDEHGITPSLVHARHGKTVPGRKRDGTAAQGLQKLHARGVLQASFRPDGEIAALRTLVRDRAALMPHRAPHLLPMPRARKQMTSQLPEVRSASMGATGQAILRAIVGGERDPVKLALFRNPACQSSGEVIATALTGTCKEELLFVLQQALVVFDVSTAQLAVCDAPIER